MRFVVALSVVAVLLLPTGCYRPDSAPPAATVDAEAQKIAGFGHYSIGSLVSSLVVALPSALTDANWGPKQEACVAAGYDLRPYAGQKVILRQYSVLPVGGPLGSPKARSTQSLWLVEKDSAVVGAYLTYEGEYPGVSAVPTLPVAE